MNSRETIEKFDRFLLGRHGRLDAVVVGGTALNLLGVVSRPTRDCDILSPPLGRPVLEAAREFAVAVRGEGGVLDDDWLNNGPSALVEELPPGWRGRLRPAYRGEAVRLLTLGRSDFLMVKFFALCDRGLDLGDCLSLRPSAIEIRDTLSWLDSRDTNPGWPSHVRATLGDLGRRLGHGLP